MMYSSTEAVTTAKATVIISNLNHLKKATLAWYADHRDTVKYLNTKKINIQGANKNDQFEIGKYMDNNTGSFTINGNQPDNPLPDGKYGLFNVEWYRRA